MATIEDRRSKSRQRRIPQSMAGEASGPLAFYGKAAALLTEADSKFKDKFTALLLHSFVNALKPVKRVKGIEPSFRLHPEAPLPLNLTQKSGSKLHALQTLRAVLRPWIWREAFGVRPACPRFRTGARGVQAWRISENVLDNYIVSAIATGTAFGFALAYAWDARSR